MTEYPPTTDSREKPLGEWVSEKVVQRWREENSNYLSSHGWKIDILDHPESIPPSQPGNFPGTSISYNPEFPLKITPLISDTTSNREEAEVAIDEIFNQISRYETGEKDGDHHSITYGEEVFTSYHIDTQSAITLAEDTERLYQSLCKKMTPHIDTTVKVVSKLFGPETASRVERALEPIPVFAKPKALLQKRVTQLIQEQEIGKLEELCSQTALIIERGAYWVEEGGFPGYFDHHMAGPTCIVEGEEPARVRKYRPESLKAAELFLRDQGILD